MAFSWLRRRHTEPDFVLRGQAAVDREITLAMRERIVEVREHSVAESARKIAEQRTALDIQLGQLESSIRNFRSMAGIY